VFEQGDEALDEDSRLDAESIDGAEGDHRSIPRFRRTKRELEEVEADLDDPESLVILDGGIDDPDGLGDRCAATSRY
jgi:hypothetical protein